MPAIVFDRFHRYAELTDIVHALAREHPNLVAVESIGKSHEGRDLWVLTVTNTDTGPAAEKPALWVDGNIHSTEVAASAANLYFLQTLVDGFGSDADITRALDTRAFYVCPRINPDGAEWALADHPKWVRSSTRPWPHDEEEIEGLSVEDIDGDGRILQMRIPDPNGLWKAHPDEPRLMVRRDPVETGGTYYRVIPEGRLTSYDGFTLKIKKRPQGLDLNRNFPASWRQEFEQLGAGPYPTSEPEVRAVVDFITRHPNLRAGITSYKYIDWFRDHPVDDDLKLIRWSDEKLDGLAHIRWCPFDHPQLGKVEIGGWNRFHAFGNPPLKLLERELARFPRWLVWQALISPKLERVHAGAQSLGGDLWNVTLVVQNTGWLPAYVSKRALVRKVVRGVIAEIELPDGATLASGKAREDRGQLEGRANKHTGVSFWPDYHVTDDRMKIEWVVRAPRGTTVRAIARHDRAGVVRADIALG